MPRIYTDANPRTIAYLIDGGGSGYTQLPLGHTSMQAEYLAIIYGLNEFFIKWNKELDARQFNTVKVKASSIQPDAGNGLTEYTYPVATPSQQTKRPLPPPILICCDSEVVVKQLSRQYHIANAKLRKLAQQIWKMTENLDVKYQWVPRAENLAGKMLK